jgi:hypothetical protein
MPDPAALFAISVNAALSQIKEILDTKGAAATNGEKLIRIGWIIGNLPTGVRESIINEAQSRVTIGWATNRKPTDW